MAKTIEGIFDPRSLKMRHDIFNVHGVGGAGSAAGGALQQQGAATVLGKTRDDIQKLFMDVLRDVSTTLYSTCFATVRAYSPVNARESPDVVS